MFFTTKDQMIEATGKVNEYWGDKMPLMCAEEAGELIQAISKVERTRVGFDKCVAIEIEELFKRDDCDKIIDEYNEHCDAMENLKKEMADMWITLGVLMNRYKIDYDQVERLVEKKLEKKY